MITTKTQRKKIYNANTGYGWIVYNAGNDIIIEIEIYIGRDNKVRRVKNGEHLLPINFRDDNNDLIEAV